MAGIESGPAGLLVVTVDRLPAWMLPTYGATWVAMPRLDGLAARGVVLDRVITPSLDPLEMLHGIAGVSAPGRPSPLAAAAVAAGWRTALVTDDPATAAARLLAGDRPGEEVDGVTVRVVVPAAPHAVKRLVGETAIARLVDAAVEAVADGHRFVWCHLTSLGTTWDAPPAYRERYVDPEDPPPPAGAGVPSRGVDTDTDPDLVVGYRQVFAGQLTLLDEQIGRLAATLPDPEGRGRQGRGWGILVAGVRGLPLGIHGWLGAGGPELPFSELVHVPAVLVDPRGRMAGQRWSGLAVPADLGMTLVELVSDGRGRQQLEPPKCPRFGRSLAGLFHDWSPEHRDEVFAAGAGGAAIVTPSWHALVAGSQSPGGGIGGVRLFAKPDDFFELADVADRCPDVAERLAAVAAAWAVQPIDSSPPE